MIDFLSENVGYIIAVFTTIFAVAGMQFKDMKIILISQLAANGLLAAQCIIGGTLSTSGLVILATVQTVVSFVFSYNNKKFPTWLTLVFMVGFTSITVIGFISPNIQSSPFDLLTMVAAWFFALAMVQQRSWICRFYSVVNTVLWMIYDAFVMPSGLINHSIIICFIIFSICVNDREEWKALFRKIFGNQKKNG